VRAGPSRLKKDACHKDRVKALREAGYFVLDAASYGMPCDVLVRRPTWDQGIWKMMEFKDPDKPPSARGLTPREKELDEIGGLFVVLSDGGALLAADS